MTISMEGGLDLGLGGSEIDGVRPESPSSEGSPGVEDLEA